MVDIQRDMLRAASEELLAQFAELQKFREELYNVRRILGQMESETLDEIGSLLNKNVQELEEEAALLKRMAECLQKIEQAFGRTEQAIADAYNLEQTPRGITKFAKSVIKIEGISRKYVNLIMR